LAEPKVGFIWNAVVEEILGNGQVNRVRIRHLETGKTETLDTDAVFINIGHTPNTDLFKGQLELTRDGYILTDRRQQTNIPGVFAAGDVQDPVYRQIVTAAGTGSAAAIEAVRFLDEQKHKEKVE
jgi:thioredoxin reductase (NADPH)